MSQFSTIKTGPGKPGSGSTRTRRGSIQPPGISSSQTAPCPSQSRLACGRTWRLNSKGIQSCGLHSQRRIKSCTSGWRRTKQTATTRAPPATASSRAVLKMGRGNMYYKSGKPTKQGFEVYRRNMDTHSAASRAYHESEEGILRLLRVMLRTLIQPHHEIKLLELGTNVREMYRFLIEERRRLAAFLEGSPKRWEKYEEFQCSRRQRHP